MLSAFFGLDHALPATAAVLCAQAPGLDGLVVNVANELDGSALQPDQWVVITRAGRHTVPVCATLRPANDPGERRTVLLIGDLGSVSDPPLRVEAPGGLPTVDPTLRAATRGAFFEPVAPLAAGPRLVIAEIVAHPVLGRSPTTPEGCPADTAQVVRVAWEGGITRADHAPTSNADAIRYHVTVASTGGTRRELSPVALADVNDNDNYHELCLNTADPATRVRVDPESFVDPNGDPNPASELDIPNPS
jgi:hypothetical protein